MSRYLTQLKALLAEKPFLEKLTELTEGDSVSSVSDQKSPIFRAADFDSGYHRPAHQDERRALVRWIADNFRSSPLGRCAHCGSDRNPADPFVALFCGGDHAELHAGCYPAWVSLKESEACVALGDSPDKHDRREE
jgi:hypothetical protein